MIKRRTSAIRIYERSSEIETSPTQKLASSPLALTAFKSNSSDQNKHHLKRISPKGSGVIDEESNLSEHSSSRSRKGSFLSNFDENDDLMRRYEEED